MGRIYYYKLTHDAGAAPCIQRGILSLAICKPIIRRSAEVGDIIFGFTANSLDRQNRLIYAALITKKLRKGEYYEGDKFTSRDDCIYEFRQGRYVRRKDAKFHNNPGDLSHDLGEHPEYPRANVLLSTDFRYFGVNGTDEYKSKYELIGKAVESLGRGQRVNLAPELREQFLATKKWLWGKSQSKVLGRPSEPPSGTSCHRARFCGVV
jgi:Nucleotide modification associated domain 2